MAERKLLWYCSPTDTIYNRESIGWNFLIINTQDKITEIRSKLYRELFPIIEQQERSSGKILTNSKLFYDLFSIISPVSKIDFPHIYNRIVKRDTQLRPRKTLRGWNTLIDKIALGKI